MQIQVAIINSFGAAEGGGNPAGIVTEAGGLSDHEMQAVAAAVGASETAFFLPSTRADYRLRFFTPNSEVELCGHATIAAYWWLHQQGLIAPGRYTQELLAGVLPIAVDADGTVTMDQSLPVFGEIVPHAIAAAVLRAVEPGVLDPNLPCRIVSTGLADVFVPITSRAALHALEPDFDKMNAFNEQSSTCGFHLFTFDCLDSNSTAHCRNFAPRFGIQEEAATGSASGALACYLWEHRALPKKRFAAPLCFEQGYSMQRPSEIQARVTTVEERIEQVQICGKARFARLVEILLP